MYLKVYGKKNEQTWDRATVDPGESWENEHVLLIAGDEYCGMYKGVKYWLLATWSLQWIGPHFQGL